MLTEIALTPQTFQGGTVGQECWLKQITLLNHRLLHYGQQCPLIFANLNDHPQRVVWRSRVANLIPQVRPQRTRQALMDLLRLIDQSLVVRPARNHVHDPGNELHWVQEAVQTHTDHPIDQVVVTYSSHAAACGIHPSPVNVNQLEHAPFWGNVSTSAFPPMHISGQIRLLRPFWLHGHTLALVLPYALEGEADWFFEFVLAAYSRPADFGTPVVELHVSFDGNGNDLITQQLSHPAVATFIQRARTRLPKGHQFLLSVRPKSHGSQRFIARRLFVVEPANVGTGTPSPRVRWGVAFEHVAMPNDAPNQTPPTFTLLPRTQSDAQHRFECITAHRLLGPVTITV